MDVEDKRALFVDVTSKVSPRFYLCNFPYPNVGHWSSSPVFSVDNDHKRACLATTARAVWRIIGFVVSGCPSALLAVIDLLPLSVCIPCSLAVGGLHVS